MLISIRFREESEGVLTSIRCREVSELQYQRKTKFARYFNRTKNFRSNMCDSLILYVTQPPSSSSHKIHIDNDEHLVLIQCAYQAYDIQIPVLSMSCVNSFLGLLYSSLTLLLTVVFLLVGTHLNGWRLTKKYGVVLMIVYFLFTILTSLYEVNVFGYVHPKECQRSDWF